MLWCFQVRSPGCQAACSMNYRRAKQQPGSCHSKQRTCHLMLLHPSGHQVPWMEDYSKFPTTAAVHQAGWRGQLAAWKPSCKKTLPSPQKPVQKVKLAHKANISMYPCSWESPCGQLPQSFPCWQLREMSYWRLRKWSSNKSRQKSFPQSHLKLNIKIIPIRYFDIIKML